MKTIITLISTVILITSCQTTPTPSNKYEEIVVETAKSKTRDTNTFKLQVLELQDTVTYLDSLKMYYDAAERLYNESVQEGNITLMESFKHSMEDISKVRQQFGTRKDYVLYYEYLVGATVKDVWGQEKIEVMSITITPNYKVLETTITGSLGTYQSQTN
jgi:hypothetical protein